jgi:hypothetical protein
MYSFYSDDFQKTGYVTDITYVSDLYGYGEQFVPVEPVYRFDDLFARYSTEMHEAISNNQNWTSPKLRVCRFKRAADNSASSSPSVLENYYLVVQVFVSISNSRVGIYYDIVSGTSANLRYQTYINLSDYINPTYPVHSNLGQIYITQYRDRDQTVTPPGYTRYTPKVWFGGTCASYLGTWNSPSSTYPYGHMVYSAGPEAALENIPIVAASQLGQYHNTAVLQEQTEIVGWKGRNFLCDYDSPFWNRLAVSYDGSYDPDPTPPGPTPTGDPNDRDPEPSDKESTGGGPHNPGSDPLPIPGMPTVGAVAGGAFNVFRLTDTEFNAFNGELYSDNAWTALKNYFNDPLDFMIGCIMVPAVATALGQLHPKFNSYVWSQAYWRVIDQYVELNCGSIVCRAYYGSCFDYSPYTKVQLFLPFIGYVELDPDEVMDMAVTIKYHIDVCTGDCVAYVSSALVSETARVIGQYNGNCGVQIPITRSNYDNVIASGMNLLAASAGAVGMYRSGAASIGAASLAGASDEAIAGREIGLNATLASRLGAATMSAVAGSKSSVSRNGTLGGTCGLMGMLKPHLLIHTPRQSKPSNYMEMRGYPSNIGGVVGDFTGYLEVSDVRLNNIPATIDEINEIYELLKGGIII